MHTYIILFNKLEDILMTTVNVSLNSIEKVKSFVNDISGFKADFDLVAGRANPA